MISGTKKIPLLTERDFSVYAKLRFFSFFHRLDADDAFGAAMTTETNFTGDLGIDGVVTAHAYVFANVETGTVLAYDDAACGYHLAVMSFGSQTLGIGVAAVVGRTGCVEAKPN